LSPEESCFLLFPDFAGSSADPALPGATMPMHCSLQNLLKGWSPEKMLPLTLATNRMKESRKGKYFHFIVTM